MLTHRSEATVLAAPAADTRAEGPDVEGFVRFLLGSDIEEVQTYVEALRVRGQPLESLCLDLFAPAARRLGRMWEEDSCDFTQVTVALCRLQQTVRRLGFMLLDEAGLPAPVGPRVLLTVTPDEQHTFGMVVVAEFFRAAGWDVVDDTTGSARELGARVRDDWFDLVGISVSTPDRLRAAAALVRSLRRASCNRSLSVIAGGPVFLGRPALAAQVGADLIAEDGRAAVAAGCRLLGTAAREFAAVS
jgi:methanogenic corrinoid protein MtbC1